MTTEPPPGAEAEAEADVVPVPPGLPRIRTAVVPALMHCVTAATTETAAYLPGQLVTVLLDHPSEGHPSGTATAAHHRVIVSVPGRCAVDPEAVMAAVERYGAAWLDVRVSAADAIDPNPVARLLAAVRRARPHWKTQLSMAAMPYGLSSTCVNTLAAAWDSGPDYVVAVVDEHFGDGFRRPPGDYAVEALASVRRQVLKLDDYGGLECPGVGILLDGYRDEEAAKVAAYALRHASWVPFVGTTAGDGSAIARAWVTSSPGRPAA